MSAAGVSASWGSTVAKYTIGTSTPITTLTHVVFSSNDMSTSCR